MPKNQGQSSQSPLSGQSKQQQYVTNFNTVRNQMLLNKDFNRQNSNSFEIEGNIPKKKQQIQYSNRVQAEDGTCYPKFLDWLGNSLTCCIITCPCFFCSCCCQNRPIYYQNMNSFGILQKWGGYQKILQPGFHLLNPISQNCIQVNRQTKTLSFRQIVFSKDNVQFQVQSVVFYRVYDSYKLVYKLRTTLQQLQICIRQIGQSSLRNILGVHLLQEIIQQRDIMANNLQEQLNFNLNIWGIFIQKCSLKEIILTQDTMESIQSVAKSKRSLEAMLINYKAQVEIGKLIKQTSQILATKAAFQIRYLDVIAEILESQGQRLIIIKTNPEDQNPSKQQYN